MYIHNFSVNTIVAKVIIVLIILLKNNYSKTQNNKNMYDWRTVYVGLKILGLISIALCLNIPESNDFISNSFLEIDIKLPNVYSHSSQS